MIPLIQTYKLRNFKKLLVEMSYDVHLAIIAYILVHYTWRIDKCKDNSLVVGFTDLPGELKNFILDAPEFDSFQTMHYVEGRYDTAMLNLDLDTYYLIRATISRR